MTKRLKFIKLITIIPLIYFFIFICASNIFAGNQTWTSGGPTGGREMDLSIGKNNIYASGYNGVWKSENKGLSWVEKNNGIPTSYDVNNIETDFDNDNVIFAGTWSQGLYKSEDGGNSWFKINSFPGNYIRKIKIDPSNAEVLYVGTGTGSGTEPGTIYKTINGGDAWQKLNLGAEGIIAYITIEPADNQTITAGIIGGTKPGRYKSEDGGITWIKFSSDTIYFPDYPTPNPQIYYKILSKKLYISSDCGISWSATNNIGLPTNFQVSYLTIDHYDANRIFLFSTQSTMGIYKSKDAGYSWNSVNEGLFGSFTLSSFRDVYVDKNNPTTIYITTNGKGVWQYTLPEITPTPTPTPLQPIVILPGLGASWNHENMILGIEKPQSEWFMTPGIKVYDGLIETLKNIGYKTDGNNKNLFIFNYNWTKPVSLTVEDFKNYLQNIAQSFPNQKIDLIGHSLGGLIARVYLQNNQNNQIDQLITIGSPHKGIPSLYYPWEGGDLSDSLPSWQRIGAGLLVHLRKPGFSTTMEAIRSTIPSIKDLLPTFNYLKENNIEKNVNQMNQKNEWLMALNNNLPNYLLSSLNTIVGTSNQNTIRWFNITSPNWLDKILGLWTDGKPQSEEKDQGDWTILKESGTLTGAKIDNLDNINHMELVTSIIGQQKIIESLGLSPNLISTISTGIDYEHSLVFQIASPATLSIIGPNGNPAGYGDGKLIIVPNAQEGKYQIKVNGTGQGEYQLHIGQIINNKDIWTTTSGFINPGEEI
ncbi:MAG: alpha/beta fold hydrolase, partial [Candidatus Shapirobacteria bacterium]|nr:alpha/beta fold hydrolase [Candidatus Shapirobacteria bacterium]